MDHICGLFQCLEGAGLVVNLSKCEIAQAQGDLFVSCGGVAEGEAKGSQDPGHN